MGYYNLGLCYFYGQGVEGDYTRAVELFQKAIENGYGDGFYARTTKLAALIAKRDADVLAALLGK